MSIHFNHTHEEYINLFKKLSIAEDEDHIKVRLLADEWFDMYEQITLLSAANGCSAPSQPVCPTCEKGMERRNSPTLKCTIYFCDFCRSA